MLTVLIPTKDRSRFVNRALTYYQEVRLKHNLLIADSSKAEHSEPTIDILKRFKPSIDAEYLKFDPEISIQSKICRALESVTTPYVVIGADDDFFIPAALGQAFEFLEKHPDYSCAHGQAMVITMRDPGSAYGPIFRSYEYYQRSTENKRAAERLILHFKNYSPLFYSVQRTAMAVDIWRTIDGQEYDLAFTELLTCALQLIQGKVKKIDMLCFVRQVDTVKEYERRADPFTWITSPGWPGKYKRFSDCLIEALVRYEGVDPGDAAAAVKQTGWLIVKNRLNNKYKSIYEPIEPTAVRRLKSIISANPNFSRFARPIWYFLQSLKPSAFSSPRFDLPALLSPRSSFHSDFMPIYDIITKGPAKLN